MTSTPSTGTDEREASDYQQIRQVLLDLAERLVQDGGLNNTEIAKLHFDAATDRLERLQHIAEASARTEAQAEKFAEYLESLEPVEMSKLLAATIYMHIMEPTNADKVSFKIEGFSRNGKVLGDMKIIATLNTYRKGKDDD